jgi:hypothetical protein
MANRLGPGWQAQFAHAAAAPLAQTRSVAHETSAGFTPDAFVSITARAKQVQILPGAQTTVAAHRAMSVPPCWLWP